MLQACAASTWAAARRCRCCLPGRVARLHVAACVPSPHSRRLLSSPTSPTKPLTLPSEEDEDDAFRADKKKPAAKAAKVPAGRKPRPARDEAFTDGGMDSASDSGEGPGREAGGSVEALVMVHSRLQVQEGS